jgi:predicted DsbA family dithiol-disulfide isomerase
VWSDVACPFCWIGERRLGAALAGLRAEWPEVAVARRWRPYQLQPDLPRPGVPWAEFARAKFGDEPAMAAAFARVAQMGAEDGLAYRFDRIAAAPNTADAHRLVLHAEAADPGGDAAVRVADALFRAYFHDGRHVGEPAVLAAVAAEQGLDAAEVRRVWAGRRTRPRWRRAVARRPAWGSAACRSSWSAAGTRCRGRSPSRRSAARWPPRSTPAADARGARQSRAGGRQSPAGCGASPTAGASPRARRRERRRPRASRQPSKIS